MAGFVEPDPFEPELRLCGSCRFHDIQGLYDVASHWAKGLGNIGYCRRMPPVILAWPRDRDEPELADEAWRSTQPITGAEDWCGEYVATTADEIECRRHPLGT